MGLLGDVLGGVCKIGFGIAKFGVETLIKTAGEAQNVRRSSRGMSDQELLNGYMNRNNSLGTRVGYGTALRDRHRR